MADEPPRAEHVIDAPWRRLSLVGLLASRARLCFTKQTDFIPNPENIHWPCDALKKRTSLPRLTVQSTLGIYEPSFPKFPRIFINHALENQHNRWAM